MWQRDELKRINLLEGSVRSGKTWISLVLWAFWVGTMPKDGSYLMVAKTLTSLRRNVLDLLQSLVGTRNFSYSLPRKEGRLFGRLVYLEGVNDARAESKIRGMTLQGAYCDELTLFTQDFFAMLLSRLSEPGAKVIATTNPDSPNHWLMTEYISRKDDAAGVDLLDIKYTLDDNTFLDPEYVKQIKREYTGVFYERFVLGRWVLAEGIIYRQFADSPESYLIDEAPEIRVATIGVDFGGNGSAHTFVCNGITPSWHEVVTLEEYYRKEIISPAQLEEDFVAFVRLCQSKYRVLTVYCDSAEQSLIQGLRAAALKARLRIEIKNAKKGPITDRIRFWCMMQGAGRYQIMRRCKHLAEAFRNAVWDSRVIGADVRLDDGKHNIDSLDACEYSMEPFMQDLIYGGR